MRGLKALGPTASNAVPFLTTLLDDPSEAGTGAATSLGYIGLPALPELVNALTNRSVAARYHALRGLGHLDFGTNATPALAPLLACLHDTTVVQGGLIRPTAILVLGRVRGHAAVIVPALTNVLTDPDYRIRLLGLQSLSQLEAEASLALPAVTQLLSDTNPLVRQEAASALRAIAPDRHPR